MLRSRELESDILPSIPQPCLLQHLKTYLVEILKFLASPLWTWRTPPVMNLPHPSQTRPTSNLRTTALDFQSHLRQTRAYRSKPTVKSCGSWIKDFRNLSKDFSFCNFQNIETGRCGLKVIQLLFQTSLGTREEFDELCDAKVLCITCT